MKPRSAISKGRKFQKTCANKILECLSPWGEHIINRPFDETDIQPQKSACAGSDVVMTTSVLQIFPFDVECKAGNSTTVEEAYRQSSVRTPIHLRPLVIIKPDRKPAAIFGLQEHIFASANEDIFAPYGKNETFGLDQRKLRNKKRLYDTWYEGYKINDKFCLYSTNPLLEPDVDSKEDLSFFGMIEFNFWMEFYGAKLIY